LLHPPKKKGGDMPKPTSEETRQHWKEKIIHQRESGLSVGNWCRQNGTSIHTFHYWQKKIFPKPNLDRSAFKEIVGLLNRTSAPGKKAGISFERKGIYIHIDKQFDLSVLKQCLKALKEMPC
jgi:hypothetical protein